MTDKSLCCPYCGEPIKVVVQKVYLAGLGRNKHIKIPYLECSKCHKPVEGKEGE